MPLIHRLAEAGDFSIDTIRVALSLAALCAAVSVTVAQTQQVSSYGRYYRLELRVDPSRRSLSGSARIVMRLPAATSDVRLFAGPSVQVDSASAGGRRANVARHGDTLVIAVGNANSAPSHGASQSVDLRVFYHDDSAHAALSYDTHAGSPVASTYGLPYTARSWWPAPGSTLAKADSADVIVTVPTPLMAVSNGRLVSTTSGQSGWRTYHWTTRHPIYPDVMSLAIADYSHWNATASAGATAIPLRFYVFRDDSAKAASDFARFPEIMSFFVDRLGPYPYANEKYGVAEFATESFREHQTIPSLGPRFITGDGRNESILAHELAHQWFGNSLSVRSWRDAWLNEGLATYAALLWREHHDGRAAYDAEIERNRARAFQGTIAVTDSENTDAMFTGTTFYKTALMVDALRTSLGDERFFAALRAYVQQNAYRLVTASDFEGRMARACGRPLDDFFGAWLTSTDGVPPVGASCGTHTPSI